MGLVENVVNIEIWRKMTKLDKEIELAIGYEDWIVYVQPESKKCPNCEILETFMTINNILYLSVNMITPEAMTELYFRYCFPAYTPVLQKGTKIYHKELWNEYGKTLNLERIKYILDPSKKDWIDVKEGSCEGGVCKI